MNSFLDILILVFAYLFGSIPWALVVGKVFYKTDIRTQGSGNLGGTNAGRVLGKKAGIAVIILDGLKALITVWLAKSLNFSDTICVLAGVLVCFGHCFPIFANFKGGKAVATAFGYLIGVSVFITHTFVAMFVIPFAVFFLCLYLSKMVSLSSMVGLAVASITTFIFQDNIIISLSVLFLFCFICYRHKGNIKRIMDKTESKIKWM